MIIQNIIYIYIILCILSIIYYIYKDIIPLEYNYNFKSYIYHTYITSEIFFKILFNPFNTIIYIIILLIILTLIPIVSCITFIWIIYWIIKILKYNDVPIFIEEKNYREKNVITFFELIKLIFIKLPKSCSFFRSYYLMKSILTKKKKKNIINKIFKKCLLIRKDI